MKILNIHERALPVPPEVAGTLIDSLASSRDALWPVAAWPPMLFDRALSVGATGGHGPVRYVVDAYTPGRLLTFRFTGPRGFDGVHRFECIGDSPARLCHTLAMDARGVAMLSWPLLFRPLHDALLEDSLATAQASLGLEPQVLPWSPWVRLLRWFLSGGTARPQVIRGRASPSTGAGEGS